MAFKLKSGNKVSFKMMGHSPLKQDETGLGDDAARIQKNTRLTKLQKHEEEKAYNEKKAADAQALHENVPWGEKAKEESATMKGQKGPKKDDQGNISGKDAMTSTDTGEGGYNYGEETFSDTNINKYKTKAQIKQDAKTRKAKSKSYGSEGDRKYTDDEKYSDKINTLADKYQRASGEGSYGLTFDWKKMLVGDSVASGFGFKRKQDIVAGKMSKLARKKRDAKTKQAGRDERKTLKTKNKAYKKYLKQQKKLGSKDESTTSFEDFTVPEKK